MWTYTCVKVTSNKQQQQQQQLPLLLICFCCCSAAATALLLLLLLSYFCCCCSSCCYSCCSAPAPALLQPLLLCCCADAAALLLLLMLLLCHCCCRQLLKRSSNPLRGSPLHISGKSTKKEPNKEATGGDRARFERSNSSGSKVHDRLQEKIVKLTELNTACTGAVTPCLRVFSCACGTRNKSVFLST